MYFVLYRVTDSEDHLLYVGATTNPSLRFADHERHKQWWESAATIKLQHFSCAEDLADAELSAIDTEHPKYNVIGVDRRTRLRRPILRAKGEGSIFQRKSDGMWVGSVEVSPDQNGHRRQRRVYGKDRATVEGKVAALRGEKVTQT